MSTMNVRSPLIFLVEDDEGIARLLILTLQEYGFEVHWERRGADLLDNLARFDPKLCIVDLGLPDMDGMEVVRGIRRIRSRCGVLILTGRGHAVDRVMGLELGADDYMVKPFEARELVARVRSILRRCVPEAESPSTGSAVAEFAGWRFEKATNRLVSPDGQEHDLSTAEAQLLCGFLENPNRILNREQLLCTKDLAPFDRSIDVRISRLRRKLEADPQNPKLIRTVYGAGYLLAAVVRWSQATPESGNPGTRGGDA